MPFGAVRAAVLGGLASFDVPAGLIVGFDGTDAEVASLDGWVRVTSLDDRYVKGAAAAASPDVTGGALTHTHSVPSHTHGVPAHTHDATSVNDRTDNFGAGASALDLLPQNHTHTLVTSSTSGTTGAQTATTSTGSNEPPFYSVIWIEASTVHGSVPQNTVVFFDGAVPGSWQAHAPSEGAFLKGAAPSADAGSSGGSETHDHTAAHTHSLAGSHSHTVTSPTGTTGGGVRRRTSASTVSAAPAHSHTATAIGDTSDVTGDPQQAVPEQSVVPPFFALNTGVATDAGVGLVRGSIGLYLGDEANIPPQWSLCDGNNGTPDMRDRYQRTASGTVPVGSTGGSITHSHDPYTHTHSASHAHDLTTGNPSPTSVTDFNPPRLDISASNHRHLSTASANVDTDESSPNLSTETNEPPFRTVHFIKLTG